MMIFAKIRFYWGATVISLITALLMIPAIGLFPRYKGPIMHYLNRVSMLLLGAKVRQEGTMDPEADMLVMNHQGIIDIVGFEALQKKHVKWIAKKELFDTFWFGNLLRWGDMISLDRGNKAALIKLLKDVKATKENSDRKVAIFPEGTRAKAQSLLPFKDGTKMIAKKLKMKVQPVIITGSKWVLNEHDRTGHSGTVYYRFLPTIDVENVDESWFKTLQETMQKEIDNEFSNHHRSR